jgi:hypothetical protein
VRNDLARELVAEIQLSTRSLELELSRREQDAPPPA